MISYTSPDTFEPPKCFNCFETCKLSKNQYMGNDHAFCSQMCLNIYFQKEKLKGGSHLRKGMTKSL